MTRSKISWLFAIWVIAVVLSGGIMMSFHQPFRTPSDKILSLADRPSAPGWRAIHVLSGSCGCSQTGMRHLLERHAFKDVAEQVVVIDGPAPYLSGSTELLSALQKQGFPVRHLTEVEVPPDSGLHGVPLLIVASPTNEVVYAGGYGKSSSQDATLLHQIRFGQHPRALPIVGCAIGSQVRRKADPFHLKY